MNEKRTVEELELHSLFDRVRKREIPLVYVHRIVIQEMLKLEEKYQAEFARIFWQKIWEIRSKEIDSENERIKSNNDYILRNKYPLKFC